MDGLGRIAMTSMYLEEPHFSDLSAEKSRLAELENRVRT